MKTETTGVSGAVPANGALPSADLLERLGFARATEGLTAPQVFYLQLVLSFHWQPNGPSIRESCRLASEVRNRIGWRTVLTQRHVASRFARLDQDILRRCRAVVPVERRSKVVERLAVQEGRAVRTARRLLASNAISAAYRRGLERALAARAPATALRQGKLLSGSGLLSPESPACRQLS